MEFRTKREAEAALRTTEAGLASAWERCRYYTGVKAREANAERLKLRAEAARIRALLPTLPD